jgi:hypothetical protein
MATIHEQKHALASRIRQSRLECYGPQGIPALPEALAIPERTWWNYEGGVALPAHTVLVLIKETGANPRWLLSGEGERYTVSCCGDRSRRAERL